MGIAKRTFEWFGKLPTLIKVGSLIFLFFVAGASILVGLLYYEFSPRRMCGSHGFHEVLSPDGAYKAVLYEYDCGATTDFGTHIALLPARERFDPYDAEDRALLFTADSNHQQVSVDSEGLLSVDVHWNDSSHLEIKVPARARVFQQKHQMGSISISYVLDDSI